MYVLYVQISIANCSHFVPFRSSYESEARKGVCRLEQEALQTRGRTHWKFTKNVYTASVLKWSLHWVLYAYTDTIHIQMNMQYVAVAPYIHTYVYMYICTLREGIETYILVFISMHPLETSFHKLTYIVSRDYICIDVIYVRRRTWEIRILRYLV